MQVSGKIKNDAQAGFQHALFSQNVYKDRKNREISFLGLIYCIKNAILRPNLHSLN